MRDSDGSERFSPLLLAETIFLLVLVGFWLRPSNTPTPTARWQVGAQAAELEPYASVDPETPISLELELPRQSHVYVVSYDSVRGSIALFPSDSLLNDLAANPLPAGSHAIPGEHHGVALRWHSANASGPVSLIALVSEAPIPELERTIGSFRQMGNAAFPTRPLLGTYAPKGGMDRVPSRGRIPTDVLRVAFDLEDPSCEGAMRRLPGHAGVFAKVLRVTAGAGPAGEVRGQIERALVQQVEGSLRGARPGASSTRDQRH
jgi:hypothetical protein